MSGPIHVVKRFDCASQFFDFECFLTAGIIAACILMGVLLKSNVFSYDHGFYRQIKSAKENTDGRRQQRTVHTVCSARN